MPKPATVNDLVRLLRRASLTDEQRLGAYLTGLDLTGSGGPDAPTPELLLNRLVADEILTPFQARQLAAGRVRTLTIGGYRVLDKLGSGGMSAVYLAEPTGPFGGPRAAIKVLDARLADDPVARERFAREAWAATALNHRNIVTVYSIHPTADPPYLVMEYVEGVTLQAAVARGGTFTAGTAAHCGREVALGLQRAATVGLVHRDIKPANLIVDRDGTVKILDLGIVRVPGRTDLTRWHDGKTILGTADYLAPEQAVDSSNVDIRADIYALGSTVYFLLAGHPPYPTGAADEKLALKQRTDPPRIDRLRPDVPAGLAVAIQTMMARRPADRYRTPAEAASALAKWTDPDPDFPANLIAARGTVSDGLRPVPTEPGVEVEELSPTGPHTAVPPPDLTGELRAVPAPAAAAPNR